jgi:leucyl-tRNA synthetase
MNYWMPVDLYVGGAEHAVLHLLYARFWTKVMADAGLVPFREPFNKLLNQGQLMGPDGQRMAKSRGNVITPDYIVEKYGADALRLYELFMAPFDQDVDWSTDGINGLWRFLNRIWNLYQNTYFESAESSGKDESLERSTHRLIRQITERIENLRFNTMISVLMEYVNELGDRYRSDSWRTKTYFQSLETLMILLAPAAPHITEELWHLTGHEGSVHQQIWPDWDAELAAEDLVEVAIQVDGKLRATIWTGSDSTEEAVRDQALALDKVQRFIAKRILKQVIYVPGRILNLVTSEKSQAVDQ